MNNQIAVDLKEVTNAINRIRSRPASEALTSDVIREYMGGFYANVGVAVNISWNAQFGRILSSNSELLGIKEIKSGQRIKDDCERETTSSLWSL